MDKRQYLIDYCDNNEEEFYDLLDELDDEVAFLRDRGIIRMYPMADFEQEEEGRWDGLSLLEIFNLGASAYDIDTCRAFNRSRKYYGETPYGGYVSSSHRRLYRDILGGNRYDIDFIYEKLCEKLGTEWEC